MKSTTNHFAQIQSTSKNLTSRLQQLENEQAKQQELVYNADFTLQQMERKVARGQGERSDEEKEQFLQRIKELEEEQSSNKERHRHLTKQCRILQQELKKWERKREQCDISKRDIHQVIDEVELEIASCELNLQKLVTEKEEDMVSLDLVRLDVRRLRDTLNNKAGEVYELQDLCDQLMHEMKQRKNGLCVEAEVRTAQLRAAEEERHRCAIELGQRSIAAEKMKLKYEVITKAHHADNEMGEEHSHVYYLIAAAQKRADLQMEGDRLDTEIRKKEKEMRSMQKTLAHLKERNTEFRQSFSKFDCNSDEYQVIVTLEEHLMSTEKDLFEAKKHLHDTQRTFESETRKLKQIELQRCTIKEENDHLDSKRVSIEGDIAKLSSEISAVVGSIEEER